MDGLKVMHEGIFLLYFFLSLWASWVYSCAKDLATYLNAVHKELPCLFPGSLTKVKGNSFLFSQFRFLFWEYLLWELHHRHFRMGVSCGFLSQSGSNHLQWGKLDYFWPITYHNICIYTLNPKPYYIYIVTCTSLTFGCFGLSTGTWDHRDANPGTRKAIVWAFYRDRWCDCHIKVQERDRWDNNTGSALLEREK